MKKNDLVRGQVTRVEGNRAVVEIIHHSEFGKSGPRHVTVYGDHHHVMFHVQSAKYGREFGPKAFAVRRPEVGDYIILTRSFRRPDLAFMWAYDHDCDVVARPVEVPVAELFGGRARLAHAS